MTLKKRKISKFFEFYSWIRIDKEPQAKERTTKTKFSREFRVALSFVAHHELLSLYLEK